MPVYSTKCPSCARLATAYRKIADRDNLPQCVCGATPVRLIDSPRIGLDYETYDCPITGEKISGKRAHEENLKRHDCRILEAGETKAFESSRKAADEAFAESFAETAAGIAASWPSEKQALLGQALEKSEVVITRN